MGKVCTDCGNLEEIKNRLARFRKEIRRALGEVGEATAPDIDDKQLLAKASSFITRGKLADPLAGLTYIVERSHNSPMLFMVRLAGKREGFRKFDRLPPGETNDCLGFGRSYDEAAQEALKKYNAP